MKLVTVSEMQAIEREANSQGMSFAQMMQNAGQGVAEVVNKHYSNLPGRSVLGLVGPGNNGGDTLVALERLQQQGWYTSAYLSRPRPDNDPYVARVRAAGGSVFSAPGDIGRLTGLVQFSNLVIDGVLGTGIHLPLKPEAAEVLNFVQGVLEGMEPRPIIVAVDCPSGVDCDNGETAQETLSADLTICTGAVKRGLLGFPAFSKVGEISVVAIGLPDSGENLMTWQAVHTFIPEREQVRDWLPRRPLDAHKGTFGAALIIAGSVNYPGAVRLAGEAAYRIGAGLVTLAAPEPLPSMLAGHLPECTWLPLAAENGGVAALAAQSALEGIKRASAVLIGPGFGLAQGTQDFLTQILAEGMSFPPTVVDADGLKLLTRIPDWTTRLPEATVLTPHPGEMAILTGLPKDQIQANRIETAMKYSQEWGHVVVLKGAFTVVAAPAGQAAVLPVATPALARAGTGDVLAGLIVGLRAQGVPAFAAAVCGAWLHANAGLAAARSIGHTAGVLASDVLRQIPMEMAGLFIKL